MQHCALCPLACFPRNGGSPTQIGMRHVAERKQGGPASELVVDDCAAVLAG
jgi:hypothetical protein